MKWIVFCLIGFVLTVIIAAKSQIGSVVSISSGAAASFFFGVFANSLRNFKYRRFLWRLIYLYFTNNRIRLSISYLIRIEFDNKFLFVHADKSGLWVPVGGVYKFINQSQRNKFELESDNGYSNSPEDDMRKSLPPKKVFGLLKFLKWFDDSTDREIAPFREFSEELFDTKILNYESFKSPIFEFVKSVREFNYSQHFQTWEFRQFDIYNVVLNETQKSQVEELSKTESSKYKFFTQEDIIRKGFSKTGEEFKIGDHACNIL